MYTYIHTHTHMKVMKQLLLNGGNPHAKTKKGETPLHFAAAKGDHIMVKILAALGVDLQVSVVYGNQSRALQPAHPCLHLPVLNGGPGHRALPLAAAHVHSRRVAALTLGVQYTVASAIKLCR